MQSECFLYLCGIYVRVFIRYLSCCITYCIFLSFYVKRVLVHKTVFSAMFHLVAYFNTLISQCGSKWSSLYSVRPSGLPTRCYPESIVAFSRIWYWYSTAPFCWSSQTNTFWVRAFPASSANQCSLQVLFICILIIWDFRVLLGLICQSLSTAWRSRYFIANSS